jgi:hypothetical protein
MTVPGATGFIYKDRTDKVVVPLQDCQKKWAKNNLPISGVVSGSIHRIGHAIEIASAGMRLTRPNRQAVLGSQLAAPLFRIRPSD